MYNIKSLKTKRVINDGRIMIKGIHHNNNYITFILYHIKNKDGFITFQR